MAVYIAFTIIGWCMVILAFFLNLYWHKKDTNKQIKALQASVEKLQMQIDEMHEGIFGNGEQKPLKWHEVVMLENQKSQSASSGIISPSETLFAVNKEFAKVTHETVNSAKDMRTAIERLKNDI